MSFGITCGSRWFGGLAACPGWSDMPPGVSVFGGDEGAYYGVASEVYILVGGIWALYCGVTLFVGSVYCDGSYMLKI